MSKQMKIKRKTFRNNDDYFSYLHKHKVNTLKIIIRKSNIVMIYKDKEMKENV